jgi:hypothetical protein
MKGYTNYAGHTNYVRNRGYGIMKNLYLLLLLLLPQLRRYKCEKFTVKMVPTTKLYNCSEDFLHNIILGSREGTESIISMCVSELGTGCNWLSTLVSVVLESHYNWLRDFGVCA